jgi:hypothetical protein
MTITHGTKTKQITLYPPTRPTTELECTQWLDEDNNDEVFQPILTIAQAMSLKENTDENLINHCITNPDLPQYFGGKSSSHIQTSIDCLLEQNFQENCTEEELSSTFSSVFPVHSISESDYKTVEIFPEKTLNINSSLDNTQKGN